MASDTSAPTPAPTSPPDVTWLDEEEMRIWRNFLEAGIVVQALINNGLKHVADLHGEDYEVLVHLSESPDRRLRMNELSDRLIHSQSRLSQRIDRLVKRGYVCREKCAQDRRGTYACLTDEGFEALAAAAPHHLLDVRAALIDLVDDDERAVLARVLERIASQGRAKLALGAPARG